jgi:hypothetical protein
MSSTPVMSTPSPMGSAASITRERMARCSFNGAADEGARVEFAFEQFENGGNGEVSMTTDVDAE